VPTYEYECKSCYNRMEKVNVPLVNSIKSAKCEKCGKKAERVFSPANIIIN